MLPEPAGVTVTVALSLPATTVGAPGMLGGGIGITAADAAEAPEVPTTFVAVEVNVYDWPLVRLENEHVVAGGVTVHVVGDVAGAGDGVTV